MICFVVYALAGSMGYIGFKTEVCGTWETPFCTQKRGISQHRR